MKKRLHVWNREDTILAFYYAKYGVMGVPIRDQVHLAHDIIGCSTTSLKMQVSNIRYAMGYRNNLPDFSRIQKEVVEEFRGVERPVIRDMVVDIVNRRKAENRVKSMNNDANYRSIRQAFRKKLMELDEIFKDVSVKMQH